MVKVSLKFSFNTSSSNRFEYEACHFYMRMAEKIGTQDMVISHIMWVKEVKQQFLTLEKEVMIKFT